MVKLSDDKVKVSDEYAVRSGPMVGALLRQLVQEVDDEVHRSLADAGFDDIRVAHHAVFQYLRPEGSRVTEIAKRTRITKQATQYLVDHLEDGGYLERIPDPEDGRSKLLRLTDRGREVEGVARKAIAQLENAWAARVGQENFAQFFAVLHDLNNDVKEQGLKERRAL
jgi:DNA-binding MarR family transcriptional regulator